MTETRRRRLVPGRLVYQETGEEIVALDLRSSTYLAINETGRTLWPALEVGATLEELGHRLCEAHGVDTAQAQRDAATFVAELEALGVLELVDGS
jgi:hypothetical protein